MPFHIVKVVVKWTHYKVLDLLIDSKFNKAIECAMFQQHSILFKVEVPRWILVTSENPLGIDMKWNLSWVCYLFQIPRTAWERMRKQLHLMKFVWSEKRSSFCLLEPITCINNGSLNCGCE